jgi:hypothetical protein
VIDMQVMTVSRDDLLDDPRFWALLYEYYLAARVGDSFDDGADYFLSVPWNAVREFFLTLERLPVDAGHYPEASVTLPLKNQWRAGVVLRLYPEDFEIQDVLVPPGSGHVVIGVNGGNSRLPALRWDELLTLADQVLRSAPGSRAKAILLLYLSVILVTGDSIDEVRAVLGDCWRGSGLIVRHPDELVERVADGVEETTRWQWSERFGWFTDSRHSLRNPDSPEGLRVLSVVRQLFASMGSGPLRGGYCEV